MSFKIASSPHIQTSVLTADIMKKVCLCTFLGLFAQCYYFGLGTLVQVALCILFCVLSEAITLYILKKDVKFALSDYTATVTGLLLGLALPAYAPWWIAFLGSFFCIVIVKQLYGGLGNNIFNPAMMGYVFLLIAFPFHMTQWPLPAPLTQVDSTWLETFRTIFLEENQWLTLRRQFDGVTMATPLDTLKTDLSMGFTPENSMTKPVFNAISGVGWFTINMAYLIGGLIMLYLKLMRWHIPIAILTSLTLCAGLDYLIHPEVTPLPWFHLFSGATMFGAFFIATDPVSTCSAPKGKLIFGGLIGLLVYIIRTYGGYPDAFAFAILIANLCVPLLDHFIRPTTYGHKR